MSPSNETLTSGLEFDYERKELIKRLTQALNTPDFQEMLKNEGKVFALNLIEKGGVFNAEQVELIAREFILQFIIMLRNTELWSRNLYQRCQSEEDFFKTLCAMANNTQGGFVELAPDLSSLIDALFNLSPFLESAGQPKLLPLKMNDGSWIILVGSTSTICRTRDGRAYRREEGSNQLIAEFGHGISFRKDATPEELCLSIHDQAAVLAKLFVHSTKEFCFALFGQWGRGKTELAYLLQSLLKKHNYQTISFSAWRHPSTPELWAYLYEAFVKVVNESFLWGIPIILRTAILRHGLWYATLHLCLLGFGLVGVVKQLMWMYSSFGISGMLLLWRLFRSYSKVQKLVDRYGRLPRHQDKLGLHTTIGEDLRYLLEGWHPFRLSDNRNWKKMIAPLFYGLAGIVVAIVLYPDECATAYWFEFFIFAAWILILIVLFILPFMPLCSSLDECKPKRFLLVVDDLDRCDLAVMLHVMESLKLLLEEVAIQSKLQVLMLVDERILCSALLQKHAYLLNEASKDYGMLFDHDLIVRENVEKLFTGHFRLLPLTEKEIDDVAEKFLPVVGQEKPLSTSGLASEEQSVSTADSRSSPEYTDTTNGGEGVVQQVSLSSLENTDITNGGEGVSQQVSSSLGLYTHKEKEELKRYFRELLEQGYVITGPRSVRYLINGYNLARLYVEQTQKIPQLNKLLDVLLAAHTKSQSDLDIMEKKDPLIRLARQIAWPPGFFPSDSAAPLESTSTKE